MYSVPGSMSATAFVDLQMPVAGHAARLRPNAARDDAVGHRPGRRDLRPRQPPVGAGHPDIQRQRIRAADLDVGAVSRILVTEAAVLRVVDDIAVVLMPIREARATGQERAPRQPRVDGQLDARTDVLSRETKRLGEGHEVVRARRRPERRLDVVESADLLTGIRQALIGRGRRDAERPVIAGLA